MEKLQIELTKEELSNILVLIGAAQIKVSDIEVVHDLKRKLQNYFNQFSEQVIIPEVIPSEHVDN